MPNIYDIFKKDPNLHAQKYEHYFAVYEKYLARFVNKPVNVLEIGVDRGGGLKMWQQYFGPKAKIFGIDILPSCAKFTKGNVKVFIGSQADREFLRELIKKLPKIDVVIDDGSHVAKHIITAFEEIYPHISDNGVYIVEDLHTSYWPKMFWSRKRRNNFGRVFFYRGRLYLNGFAEYAGRLIHQLNSYHRDPKSYKWFLIPRAQRKAAVPADDLAKNTRGIYFHDCMAVFERGKMPEPLRLYK